MRLKTFGLAALTAVAAMAFVGVTSATAAKTTQLCTTHESLDCSSEATSVHIALATGEVASLLLGSTVLCLGLLIKSSGTDVGILFKPQRVDATLMSFTGCGTTAAHENCTVTVEELPANTLLKTGLDTGSLEALIGRIWVQCSNGIDCVYDLAGLLFSVGAQHFTASESFILNLGNEFCLNGKLDALLKTLENRYVLR